MRDRYPEFEQRRARVIAIAPDARENARRYFERESIPFTCLADEDRGVFRLYDVKSTLASLGQRPGLFIIDAEGIVRYAYLGWQQWEIPTVDETLAELDALT